MIPRSFFQRDPLTCARDLIGCELVWKECSGLIVETEAYSVVNDEACHAFCRPSTRAYMAAHQAGTSYVYLNYGVHWLLNVLLKDGPEDGFVLIRALEPRRGLALMEARRGPMPRARLCSGPGRLTQALGVTGADHARDLCGQPEVGFLPRAEPAEVVTDRRIGITKAAEHPWRFLLSGHKGVSVAAGKGR